jgi:hypothetical protein
VACVIKSNGGLKAIIFGSKCFGYFYVKKLFAIKELKSSFKSVALRPNDNCTHYA